MYLISDVVIAVRQLYIYNIKFKHNALM